MSSNVIRFPRPSNKKKRLPLARAERGMSKAEALGFDPADIRAAAMHDLWMAGFLLGLLGSDDDADRRGGEVGLRRLINSARAA